MYVVFQKCEKLKKKKYKSNQIKPYKNYIFKIFKTNSKQTFKRVHKIIRVYYSV